MDLEEELSNRMKSGAVKLIELIMSDPAVGRAIGRALTKYTINQVMPLILIFIGIIALYSALKSALGVGWTVDLAVGFLSIFAGIIIRRRGGG